MRSIACIVAVTEENLPVMFVLLMFCSAAVNGLLVAKFSTAWPWPMPVPLVARLIPSCLTTSR